MAAGHEHLSAREIALLAKQHDVEVVRAVSTGRDAVAAIRDERPDVAFLDVQMPGLSGIDVASEIGGEMPATIFITAYGTHAVKAFELEAVDYLVKPFDDERFEEALRRARRAGELRAISRRPYVDRIPVELRGQVRAVPVDQIDSGGYGRRTPKRAQNRTSRSSSASRTSPASISVKRGNGIA